MAHQAAVQGDLAVAARARPITEDWLAVAVGGVIFALALALAAGVDLMGWATAPRTWIELGKSVRQASPLYAAYGTPALLLATYPFVLALLSVGALLLGSNIVKFVLGFSVIYWLSYLA